LTSTSTGIFGAASSLDPISAYAMAVSSLDVVQAVLFGAVMV
jgi:hypothetical protein